jgi:hypothetical protein
MAAYERDSGEIRKEFGDLIEKFQKLDWPNPELTKKILTLLSIHSIVDLEFTLNSRFKNEREAALKMLMQYFDDLSSGVYQIWAKAKSALEEIYYQVSSTDEEALL